MPNGPDTAYEYSNYGFALLGRIVARCSGVPYAEYISRHILEHLQMRASALQPEAVPPAVRATGYGQNGSQYFAIPSLPHGAFGSMGGMQVSARDLGRYVAFHLSAWPPRDDPDTGPVRRSSVREMQHPWRPSAFLINTPDRPQSARTSAYGYGLSVSQTCQFRRIVAHSGGLPGFGSNMMWLPDYGVGIFVMTNLTYTSGAAAVEQALDEMRKTGALQPRQLPPSAELLATREAILRVWNGKDQRDLEKLSADNLFLDTNAALRMKRIEQLQAQAGACRDPGPMQPDNLLRGGFRIPCEKGIVSIYFTLAPTMPPKVQNLALGFIPNLSPAEQKSVEKVGAGNCRVAELLSRTTADSGPTEATVRLECDQGPLLARVDLAGDGKLTHVTLVKPDDQACTP